MNQRDLLLRLLKISEQFNMDQKDLSMLVVKVIVISMKYLDRRELFSTLFPDQYVDWELVDISLTTTNPLGDTEPWLSLLGLLDWSHWNADREIEQNHKPLSLIKAGLKANNLDLPGWSLSCNVLILQLIQGLQSMHAIELLTARAHSRNTREGTMHFLANLHDTKLLPSAYLSTLAVILSSPALQINCQLLTQTMSIVSSQREEHRLNLRLKSMQLVALRPRLRDRLKTSLLTEQNKEQIDSQLGTWDSFTGFCHTHRFPNNLSDKVKRQLYFLAAQTHWDWSSFVSRFIQIPEIEGRVQQRPVLQPDANTLYWVINHLSMDGKPPFPEMMAFKAKCFVSFPIVYVQRMTLTQVLRLYVAAYQHMYVWKDVWKSLIGILSPQIIRDCETFVSANPFAGEWVVEALLS